MAGAGASWGKQGNQAYGGGGGDGRGSQSSALDKGDLDRRPFMLSVNESTRHAMAYEAGAARERKACSKSARSPRNPTTPSLSLSHATAAIDF